MADHFEAERATEDRIPVRVVGPAAYVDVLVGDLSSSALRFSISSDHQAANAVVLVEPGDEHWDEAHSFRRPIVLVTRNPLAPDAMLAAVMRGADAVIDGNDTTEIARAIRTVLSGGVVLSAEFTRRLADALRSAATEGNPVILSRRERQILDCISEGQSVKATAATLAISAKTVENLQTRLYKKLGVRNRNQAVALARALGLIT